MITAYKINKLGNLSTIQLNQAIRRNGHADSFKEGKFLGITNAKQFVYEVLYFDTDEGEDCYTKIFVDLNESEEAVANY
jgi:hypothetical protein